MKEKVGFFIECLIVVAFLCFIAWRLFSCGFGIYTGVTSDRVYTMENCDSVYSGDDIKPRVYVLCRDGDDLEVDADFASVPDGSTHIRATATIGDVVLEDTFKLDPPLSDGSFDAYFLFRSADIPSEPEKIDFEFSFPGSDGEVARLNLYNIEYSTSLKDKE